MATTYPLSITLQTPDSKPVPSVKCIITPVPAIPSSSGVVLTTATATTDANGHAVINLIPNVPETYYEIRFNTGLQLNVVNPFRFQMPAQATSLTSLIQGAISRNEPIPEGIHVEFPSPPFSTLDYPSFTDTSIPVGDAAFTFGDWVDIYHLTNNNPETGIYLAFFDLIFDPAWAFANDDRGEVDVRLRHIDSDGTTVIRELERHNFDYVRNLDVTHSKVSVKATGLAELSTGQYIEVDVRAGRQQSSTARSADRTVVLNGSDSTLQIRVDRAITLTTVRIATDNTLKLSSTGYGVTNPFTTGDENKLDAIEAGAQVNRTNVETRDSLYSLPTTPVDERLDITRLKGYFPPTSVTPDLDDLTDVTITNPQDGDMLIKDGTDFVNRQPHATLDGDDIVNILENRQPSKKLKRTALQGQTTVEGSDTLPAPADVDNFTLYVRQSTSADNPGLYLAGANYDVPISNRNRIIVTPDSTGEFFLGQRGSVVDNYNNVFGQFIGRAIGGGQALLGVAIHFGSDTPVTTPPTVLYVRGINGSNSVRAIQRSVTSQRPTGTFSTINGTQYAEYVDTVASSVVDQVDDTPQTLTFFTNAVGSLPLNLKPTTEHRARAWHLQTHVQADFNQTDSQSPHFIQNKPTIVTSSIGGVIAESTALPTTSTALQRRGTTNISSYLPAMSAGAITAGYTVSANTIECTQPHDVKIIGWYARAVRGTTELCRLFIPLNTILPHVDLTTILSPTRVASHAYMGEFSSLYCYLAYQSSSGAQPRQGQTGTRYHDIELFVVTPNQPASVAFLANTKIQLTEAVMA